MRSSRERGGAQRHPQRHSPGGIGPGRPTGPTGTGDADLGWLQAIESVWPEWDPPAVMHPDHPSAPLPRVGYVPEELPRDEPRLRLWLAQRVLTEADEEAAWIRAAAQREADQIRQQAAAIRQRAVDDAAAILAAAKRDAAQMRAAMLTTPTEPWRR
jgi:hypothetical protein